MNADGTGVTRLTNNAAQDSAPVWSPDGSRIAFSSDRDGNNEIYVMNADGTGQTRRTNNSSSDGGPGWSPDGSRIAFRSDRDGNHEVYVMNADGTGQTRLTNNAALDTSPAWSPDGTKIAFQSDRPGNNDIYVMNANGTSQVNLTNNAGIDMSPTWSPDGAQIAFESSRDGNFEIYVMTASGAGQTRLTNNGAPDSAPAWSPDGSNIAFQSSRDGNLEIYVMNSDGAGQTRRTNHAAADYAADWQPVPLSPRDEKIVFVSWRDGNGEIYVMNADGTDQTRITNNTADDLAPAWSPDGSRIAFHSDRDGNWEIYVMNISGTGQTRLTNYGANDLYPAWSPDGSKIAFSSERDGNHEIYVMNANGTGQARITNNAALDTAPTWSPDGSKIAFSSDRTGNNEIYAMNANGTSQVNLTNNAGLDMSPVWSPDGAQIAFKSDRDGNFEIYVMSADGATWTKLTSEPADAAAPAWSPDGSQIAYFNDKHGNTEIFTTNATGSTGAAFNRLTFNPASDDSPDWRPARSYYFTWYDNIYARNWILMAKPAGTESSYDFQLSVRGYSQDLAPFALQGEGCPGGGQCDPGQVPAGRSLTPIFSGLMGGPVKIRSLTGGKAIVSERTVWAGNSLEEVLGQDQQKLSSHFYWTWYDQQSQGFSNWVLISNPNAFPVYHRVLIGGAYQGGGIIGAGSNLNLQFPGIVGGPVEVLGCSVNFGLNNSCSQPANTMASQRVLSNFGSSFNEVPGMPAADLSHYYLWTWYDQLSPGASNWILIANPAGDSAANIYFEVEIAGQIRNDGTVQPGVACKGPIADYDSMTPQFPGVQSGPVEVRTYSDPICDTPADAIVSQRSLWGPSFEEVPGQPYESLYNSYHWTWYDQASSGVTNWVLIANPSSTQNIDVEIYMNGQKVRDGVGPHANPTTWVLGPGQKATPTFGAYMGGPVEVRAFISGTDWPAPVITSQRVVWNGHFNEVLGTLLN